MDEPTLPIGPDPEAITLLIRQTWPETAIATIEGATFFSLDEKHWPNFATIVWTDDFDQSANLYRPGVFRLNIGLGRETFQRLVGSIAEPDHMALDRLMPHPVYAGQHWVGILNPSDGTFRDTVMPLLAEAHDRLAAQRARHARTTRGTARTTRGTDATA